jgi:NAD(P)-dependent dehydrogenase (short-subunit alcohol dehydrogenase family)
MQSFTGTVAFITGAGSGIGRAARLILRGMERGKPRLVIGADGRLMELLGRYAPIRYPQMTYPVLRRVEPLIGAAVDGLAAVPKRE